MKTVQFESLKSAVDLVHGIFTRVGGFSPPPFDSLNTGFNTGDNPETVEKNRELIINTMGGGLPIFLDQVHGKNIFVLKKRTYSLEMLNKEQKKITADGVITDIPGLLLFILVADCQPVLLFDPVNRVIANIHSGWRGSIRNIIGSAVDGMTDAFGSDPETILAGIGPSLGPCCSEFIHYRKEIPESLWDYKVNDLHFDFWEISRNQLLDKGLKSENIDISRLCTKCSHSSFFSYRAEKITGRFAAVIGLK